MAHNVQIGGWTYGISEGFEYSRLAGVHSPRLRPHSHPEAQFCAVVQGQRTFWTPHGLVSTKAGEILFIAPYTIHQALECNYSCFIYNVYAPTDALRLAPDCTVLIKQINTSAALTPQIIIEQFPELLLREQAPIESSRDVSRYPTLSPLGQVAGLAKAAGVSREHFSRRFRKQFGLPPQILLMGNRVNFARSLLKDGAEPCSAALEAGFSDQSHMTRHFNAFFGIAPGHYQRSLAQRE